MVQKGIFWTIGEHSYFVYYPIISYQRMKVYRVERMDMRRFCWNNGVSGNTILVNTVLFIVRDKILW